MTGKLEDVTEVLFRQIHPKLYLNGAPASNRFRPSDNDVGQLSLDRGSLTTAEKSHKLYVSSGKESAAVFGVSVGEFNAEMIECVSDPVKKTAEHPANDAHALADYRQVEKSKWDNVSKRLKRKAVARGLLYAPTA